MFRSFFYTSFLLFCFIITKAQDFSNKGKDFWVGYGYHHGMITGNEQNMVLYFTSDVNAAVKVEIPALGWVKNYTVTANSVLESDNIPKDGSQDARLLTEGLYNTGIHITSDQPIVAYAHIYNSSVSGASLLFPVNTLGQDYYALNFTQRSNADDSNSWAYVVATDDNTAVEITPSANTLTHAAGTPFIVTLNKGEIYNLMGVTNFLNGVDLTGTRIRSVSTGASGCKKIAVFSGAGRLMINCSNNVGTSDNIIQQSFPRSAWGRKYLTVPTAKLPNNFFRIAVSDPSTVVTVNGVQVTNLVNGFYYEMMANTPQSIVADKPVIVSQYITSTNDANGPACGNSFNGNGDPEMIYLSPIEQTIDKITLNSTNHYSITFHYINVIIKSSAVNSFTLDGVSLPSSFIQHPSDPAYSYAVFSVNQGAHNLKADSGFNAIAYGYGLTESYGYNAGTNLKDLNQYLTLQTQYATTNSQTTCRNTPFLFSITLPYQPSSLIWNFGNTPGLSPNQQVTNNIPIADSSFQRDGKTLYVYKLSSPYKFTASGTYTVKLTASAPSGDGCNGQQELSYDITVTAAPVADFSVSHTGCAADTAFFTDASNGNGSLISRLKWDFGDGVVDSVKNPHKAFAAPNTYNVKLTAINDIGCSADTTKPFIIDSKPVANFGFSDSTCSGTTVIFSDSSTIATGNIAKWYWNFGNGKTLVNPTNAPVTSVYDTEGNYTVTLQTENSSGCKSNLVTRQVTIHPAPFISIDMPGACLPNAIATFSNTSGISDGTESSLTWLWNFGDGTTSTDRQPTHTYTAAGPFDVHLKATSLYGCTTDSVKTFSNIYKQPVASFDFGAADICVTDSTRFRDNSTALNSSVTSWFWNFGNGTIATSQNPVSKFANSGSYTVSLLVRSAFGCASDTTRKPVFINALPTAKFSIPASTCQNMPITITDQSASNSGTLRNWFWAFGDGTSASYQTKDPFQFTATNAGKYDIQLVVETDKGCKSDTFTQTLTVNPEPVANFILPEVCVSDAFAAFKDSSYIPGASPGGLSYTWQFGDPAATTANPNTSTDQNPQHTYSSAGIYTVSLTTKSSGGCTSTVTKTLSVNGLPKAAFKVVDDTKLCSNKPVSIQNTSSADVGAVTKIEIAWDAQNAPTNVITDDNPVAGTIYTHQYSSSATVATYQIKLRAYSGSSCYSDSTVSIQLNPAPKVVFSAVPGVCLLDPAFPITQAKEVSGIGGTGFYSGAGVSSAGIFTPATAGAGESKIVYSYTFANGCIDTAEQVVRVTGNPVVTLNPQVRVLEGGSLVLNPLVTGNVSSYQWTPPTYLDNPNILSPRTTPVNDITYSLAVKTVEGCAGNGRVLVTVLHALGIPNAFSPNGDGINDTWNIAALDSYPDCVVQVFNRYGKLVFSSTGYSKPWTGSFNGSPLPVGVYYYIVDTKTQKSIYKGSVTILR